MTGLAHALIAPMQLSLGAYGVRQARNSPSLASSQSGQSSMPATHSRR